MPIIVAIIGSRKFSPLKEVENYVRQLYSNSLGHQQYLVISGGARGVDKEAEKHAKEWGLFHKCYLPDWTKYGKKAGFIRNEEIIKNCDVVTAFWDGESKGTKHSIDLAMKYKKKINIFIRPS